MMRTGPWRVGGAAALFAVVSLAGCSSGSSASSSGATAAGGGPAPAAGSTGGSTAPAATPAGQTTAQPAPAAAATGNHCATIDLAAATALLGGNPRQLPAAAAGTGDDEPGVKITKLDGCSYTGSDPSLGYDVNQFDGMGPVTSFIAAAKAQLAAQPGVTPFDVSLGDQAVGFTVAIGPKTMARIEVAKGTSTVAVAVTGSDPAKAKAVAIEAATRLLAVAR